LSDRTRDVLPVEPNRQYSVASPDSIAVRIATWQRRRMFARFLADAAVGPADTILDVGVTADSTYASSNYLEAWCDNKARIVAAGVDDASFLEDEYPGLRFVFADGLRLPFADRSFDVVHSSAVIEHVGSTSRQAAYVRECARVARRAVFLTTPNRWFPVEFHTVLPLVHWLPKSTFQQLMRHTGRSFFADEANLNLLSRARLRRLAADIDGYAFDVSSVALLGWPSNLLLIGRRTSG
jgi:ubiquinone/menaquinone biosynthesis C-methylase UbiE